MAKYLNVLKKPGQIERKKAVRKGVTVPRKTGIVFSLNCPQFSLHSLCSFTSLVLF